MRTSRAATSTDSEKRAPNMRSASSGESMKM
jgi:hypothetical protein